jgi:hypothetical protein
MRATCATHLLLLRLIVGTIFGEAYRLRNFQVCKFLNVPTTSVLLGPNIPSANLFKTAELGI